MIRNLLLGGVVLLGWIALWSHAEPARFDISQFGAKNDGTTVNTRSIQSAIDACAQAGGGTVVVPGGTFLSGALFLKPGVNLELQKDAVVKGSANIDDYPRIVTRIEGHFEPWRAGLLNADGARHLRIDGPGTLDGNGAPYWKEFWTQRKLNPEVTNLAVERPRLVFIQNADDVQVNHVLFKDSGFWNLHLYHSQNVAVSNCQFRASNDPPPNHAASSDGIDVDSCQDVTIERCKFAVGDDCIALKGSKGPFAIQDRTSPPVERVRINDCTFETGGAVVTFGSEATIVRNIEVIHCRILGPVPILRLKLRPDTEQLYENIVCRDIVGANAGAFFDVAPWKQFFNLQGQPAPGRIVRNVRIEDVRGTFHSLGRIVGNPGDRVTGLTLKNVDVQFGSRTAQVQRVDDLKLENVIINGAPVRELPGSTSPAASPTPEAWNTF